MRLRLARSILAVGSLAALASHRRTSAEAAVVPQVPARGVAIVTGGGRGIGAACSEVLAARGYGVVIAYRSDEASAQDVCRRIAAGGGVACAARCDVGVEEDVVALFKFADAFRGEAPLSVLVNNAGQLGKSTCDLAACTERGPDDLLDMMRTNVAGPLLTIREAEKRMSTANGGCGGAIVQISSGAAYIGGSPLLYATTKGALNSLTIGLVAPLAKQGIRINTVSPGMTDTDMVAEAAKTFDFSLIPLGRMGTPREIANTVAWLCSDEASYVAGANIRVAGGRPPGTTLG